MKDAGSIVFEQKLKKIQELQEDILWQEDEKVKQNMLNEIKIERANLINNQKKELELMEEEVAKAINEQRQKIYGEASVELSKEEIDKKEEQCKLLKKKMELILVKHELKMMEQLDKVGIKPDDFVFDNGKKIKLTNYIKRPKITCDINNGIYSIVDQSGKNTLKRVNTDLLDIKVKKEFSVNLLKKQAVHQVAGQVLDTVSKEELKRYILSEGKDKKTRTEIEKEYISQNKEKVLNQIKKEYTKHKKQFELISEFTDLNLFYIYYEMDSKYADNYILALDLEDKGFMPTEVEYVEESILEENANLDEIDEVKEIDIFKTNKEKEVEEKTITLNINSNGAVTIEEPKEQEEKNTFEKIKKRLFSKKDKKKMRENAKGQEELGLVIKHEKETGFKRLWKKIAIAIGITGATLALAAGQAENEKEEQEKDWNGNTVGKIDDFEYKESLKFDFDKVNVNPILVEETDKINDKEQDDDLSL